MFVVCVIARSLKDNKAHGRYVRRNRRKVDWLTGNPQEARIWRTRRGAERFIRNIPDLDAEVVPLAAPVPEVDLMEVWYRAEIAAAQAS